MGVGEKIGWYLGCLVDVEVQEGLRIAMERKYPAVEILGDESLSDMGLRGLWPWEEQLWNVVKPMLASFRFKAYHAPFAGLNFLTLNPVLRETTLEQIKCAINTASEMDLSPVIIHPGVAREGMDERVVSLLLFTLLTEVADYAAERQVKVAVECCEHFANISMLQHSIAQIDSPYLGVCLDINEEMAKLNGMDTESLSNFIREIGDKIFHVRFHGMTLEQSNSLNYENIAQTLLEVDYPGAFIFRDEKTSESSEQLADNIYKVG